MGAMGGDQCGQEDFSDHNSNAEEAAAAVSLVIGLAEKYYDRVDPAQFLEILPPNTPVAALLRYCKIVMEYRGTCKRNMQVP
jgi:hypothetical protein